MKALILSLCIALIANTATANHTAELPRGQTKLTIRHDPDTQILEMQKCTKPYPNINHESCETVLKSQSSVNGMALGSLIASDLARFNEQKENKSRRRWAGVLLLVGTAGVLICLATVGSCIWAPILLAADGSLMAAVGALLADAAFVTALYKGWKMNTVGEALNYDLPRIAETLNNMQSVGATYGEVVVGGPTLDYLKSLNKTLSGDGTAVGRH
ncbi:MAG TPA: hypothetical protein VFV50_00880 [Bdellovibrionales bacterium]|nr:hypothetical protein [Bdellovibrionales bacterium]